MVFSDQPVAHSSPNLTRACVGTSVSLSVTTSTTDATNKAPRVSAGSDVTSSTSCDVISRMANGTTAVNGSDVHTSLASKTKDAKERRKVKRNVNGVIKKPNFSRIRHIQNVDIIIEESPEELMRISPITTSPDCGTEDTIVSGQDGAPRTAEGADSNVGEGPTRDLHSNSASTLSLTSLEKKLLSGEFYSEGDNLSLSSLDQLSLTRIDDVMSNVNGNNCDAVSLSSVSSMDVTYTADVNGQEVKFIESTGKCHNNSVLFPIPDFQADT